MTANDIFQDSHLSHVRSLKTELARVRQELVRAHETCAELKTHFALALAVLHLEETLPPPVALYFVDGWNALLGSATVLSPAERALSSADKEERLVRLARTWCACHPNDLMWLIFDGETPHTQKEKSLLITYTGGTGLHRADRFICDYLRMHQLLALSHAMHVLTEDRSFRAEALRLGAQLHSVQELLTPN